ncbi:putative reverse transcriptase domain-containing protein [Tanacetum coccineum]
MEILLEPTSNKLMVGGLVAILILQLEFPVKEILLKLILHDHSRSSRNSEDGGEDTERLSRIDKVLTLKNFKKDATLKLFKSTNQERYEHVDPEVTSSQDGKVHKMDTHLSLAESSYNNSYHSSIRCALFEALYGRKCRSLVLWAEVGENRFISPEMVQETTNKVVLIKERLKAARDRQKSYADNRRKPLEFEVGDRVLLKVSPWKGAVWFGKKGKLAPRYVGPFEILERLGPVAYRLRLPQELNSVHDTFYVSNLEKCLTDANLHVPLKEIRVEKTLRFVEEPEEIMDREVKKLKRSRILIIKFH